MNSTSWSSYQPSSDGHRNMYRASTAPAADYPAHPASLMPGHVPQPINRPDLYFTNPTQMPVPYNTHNAYFSHPPPPTQYPIPHTPAYYHYSSLPILRPPPPLPPRLPAAPPRPLLSPPVPFNIPPTHLQSSLPPVPPKPFQSSYDPLPHFIPHEIVHSAPSYGTTSDRNPSESLLTDESDIALAMALSESVSKEEQETRQMLITEEEDELARALTASLIEVQSPLQLDFDITPVASSSQIASSSSYDDETFARLLAAEQEDVNKIPLSEERRIEYTVESSHYSFGSYLTNENELRPQIDVACDTFTGATAEKPSITIPASTSGCVPLSYLRSDERDVHAIARLLGLEESQSSTPSANKIPEVQNPDISTFTSTLGGELPQYSSSSSRPSSSSIGCDEEAVARPLGANADEQHGSSATSKIHYPSNAMSPIPKDDLPQYPVIDTYGSSPNVNCDDDEAFARLLAAERYDTPYTTHCIAESNDSDSVTQKRLPEYFAVDPRPSTTDGSGEDRTKERHDTPSETNYASSSHPTSSLIAKGGLPQYSVQDDHHFFPGASHGGKKAFAQSHMHDILPAAAHITASTSEDTSTGAHPKPPEYSTEQSHKDKAYTPVASTTNNYPNSTGSETPLSLPMVSEHEHVKETNLSPQGAPEPPHYSLQNISTTTDQSPDSATLKADGRPSNTHASRQSKIPESSMPTSPSNNLNHSSPPLYLDDTRSTVSTSSVEVVQQPPFQPVAEILHTIDSSHPPPAPFSRHQSLIVSPLQIDTSSSIGSGGSSEMGPSTLPHERLGSDQLRPSPSTLNLNAFVDKELFNGVSIGFMAPKISAQIVPMSDEMPPIISLPYGKARPLHLQGPSWKHLLKLMAKLSGTRVEPSLDAITVTKTPPKLRTVIQFVKPHHASLVWRSIFYFTIDYPPPQPIRNGGVNDLPYSYSLAGIPTLLRDAVDTPLSKTYTIPASESVPYPTLPITFPQLALYLQAALEESRRYLSDNSSGNRKLAKMINTCYPTEEDPQDNPDRSSVGGLFKSLIGRSNRSSRRGGNEERYEFVTPFVANEWG